MKIRTWFAAALALAASGAWAQSGTAAVDPGLQSAVSKFAEAFNAADPKAFASHFTADATLMNPMGMVAHGPADIEKLFAQNAVPIFKGSRSTMTITGSRQVAPDVVWVDVDHDVQNARTPDGKVGAMKPHMVLLARKEGGEWKWAEARAALFVPRDRAHGGPPVIRPK